MGLRTTDIQDVHPISYQRTFSQPILTVKDVSLFYKKHPVLEHISLQASKGDIIGVVGPNGAGKTTFLRTLCGCIKNYGLFLLAGTTSKGNREDETFLYGNAGCEL